MNALTPAEAVRCAKAWLGIADINRASADALCMYTAHRGALDPHFWLPKLWEKLEGIFPNCSLTADPEFSSYETFNGYEVCHGPHDADWVSDKHPCLALVKAVEALEAK